MVLNIKNLFKKVCMLSAAATMAVGLGASFAEAGEPKDGTTGIPLDDSVTIGASATTLTPSIELATGLKYTGSPLNLIKSASIIPPETITNETDRATAQTAINDSGAALWLRVVKNGTTDGKTGWTKVWENGTAVSGALSESNLQGTQNGTYDVYYYIDGNGNYNDVKAESD